MTGKSEFYLKTQTYEDFITTMYIRADSFICNSRLYDTKWIKRNSISCIYIHICLDRNVRLFQRICYVHFIIKISS